MSLGGRSDPKPLSLWCLSMGKAIRWLGLTRAALKSKPQRWGPTGILFLMAVEFGGRRRGHGGGSLNLVLVWDSAG